MHCSSFDFCRGWFTGIAGCGLSRALGFADGVTWFPFPLQTHPSLSCSLLPDCSQLERLVQSACWFLIHCRSAHWSQPGGIPLGFPLTFPFPHHVGFFLLPSGFFPLRHGQLIIDIGACEALVARMQCLLHCSIYPFWIPSSLRVELRGRSSLGGRRVVAGGLPRPTCYACCVSLPMFLEMMCV